MKNELTGTEARVCQDIAARQAKGIAKYGTTVEDNPLGLLQWLQHAYEETLDQAVYLKRSIEHLQGLAPEGQPKSHINLPVVDLPASMRCGDAINVPPLKAEMPWYPDDGDWKDVDDELMDMPSDLSDDDYIQVLRLSERKSGNSENAISSACLFDWTRAVNQERRIVAYKVLT